MELESELEESVAVCQTYEDFIDKIKGMMGGTNTIDRVKIYDEIHLTISDHIGIY